MWEPICDLLPVTSRAGGTRSAPQSKHMCRPLIQSVPDMSRLRGTNSILQHKPPTFYPRLPLRGSRLHFESRSFHKRPAASQARRLCDGRHRKLIQTRRCVSCASKMLGVHHTSYYVHLFSAQQVNAAEAWHKGGSNSQNAFS